jgi:hypothetical protein
MGMGMGIVVEEESERSRRGVGGTGQQVINPAEEAPANFHEGLGGGGKFQ